MENIKGHDQKKYSLENSQVVYLLYTYSLEFKCIPVKQLCLHN